LTLHIYYKLKLFLYQFSMRMHLILENVRGACRRHTAKTPFLPYGTNALVS